jgi:hypothetical protein
MEQRLATTDVITNCPRCGHDLDFTPPRVRKPSLLTRLGRRATMPNASVETVAQTATGPSGPSDGPPPTQTEVTTRDGEQLVIYGSAADAEDFARRLRESGWDTFAEARTGATVTPEIVEVEDADETPNH